MLYRIYTIFIILKILPDINFSFLNFLKTFRPTINDVTRRKKKDKINFFPSYQKNCPLSEFTRIYFQIYFRFIPISTKRSPRIEEEENRGGRGSNGRY